MRSVLSQSHDHLQLLQLHSFLLLSAEQPGASTASTAAPPDALEDANAREAAELVEYRATMASVERICEMGYDSDLVRGTAEEGGSDGGGDRDGDSSGDAGVLRCGGSGDDRWSR